MARLIELAWTVIDNVWTRWQERRLVRAEVYVTAEVLHRLRQR